MGREIKMIPPSKILSGYLDGLRALFEEFGAARFDAKIEEAAKSGGFDEFAEKTLSDLHAGRALLIP